MKNVVVIIPWSEPFRIMPNQSTRNQVGGRAPNAKRTKKMVIDAYNIGFLPIMSDSLPWRGDKLVK